MSALLMPIMRDRRRKLKKCVYCGLGKEAGQMSKEHIVPKGLWETKPDDLVTVPAHVDCNGRWAADNEYFKLVMANIGHDLGSDRAKAVTNGSISRLMTNRPEKFLSITDDFEIASRFTDMGIYVGDQPRFKINPEVIKRVLANILRCVYYDLTGNRLSEDATIRATDAGGESETTEGFGRAMGPWQSVGRGVFLIRYGFKEDFEDICAYMRFYGRQTFLVTSDTPENRSQDA